MRRRSRSSGSRWMSPAASIRAAARVTVGVARPRRLASSPGGRPSSCHRQRRMYCWPSCTPCRAKAVAEARASTSLTAQKAGWNAAAGSSDMVPPAYSQPQVPVLNIQGSGAFRHDVELVALRVQEGYPLGAALVILGGLCRAETDNALHLGVQIRGDEIRVHPVLAVFPSCNPALSHTTDVRLIFVYLPTQLPAALAVRQLIGNQLSGFPLQHISSPLAPDDQVYARQVGKRGRLGLLDGHFSTSHAGQFSAGHQKPSYISLPGVFYGLRCRDCAPT